MEETEAKNAEIYNAMTGDFLTENPAAAASNFGPGRVIGFKAKGLNEEVRAATRDAQVKQIEEKKIQLQNEKQLQKYWEDYANQINKEVFLKDMELKKTKRLSGRGSFFSVSRFFFSGTSRGRSRRTT